MGYLIIAAFAYYLVIGVASLFLTHGSEEEQQERAYRWRSVVGLVYWLVNAPILFTVLLWLTSSRWSLSFALLPVWLGLLLLSAMAAGAYLRLARLRWPLLLYALLLGLIFPLWLGQNYEGTLYEQYPFRVKVAYRDYVEQPSFWEQGPTYYGVTELHMASAGFDYNMGDISLEYPPTHDFGFWPQPALAQISDSVWHHVRSLHFSPDSNKGRVIFSPLPSASRYNAFTNRVELPKEQVLDFRLNMSPQPRQRPQ
jgi:hypothetical protein